MGLESVSFIKMMSTNFFLIFPFLRKLKKIQRWRESLESRAERERKEKKKKEKKRETETETESTYDACEICACSDGEVFLPVLLSALCVVV